MTSDPDVVAGLRSWPPDDQTVRCPHALFAELRERAPVYRCPDPTPEGVHVYVVTSWEACASVLMRADEFTNDLEGLVPPHVSGAFPAPEPETPTFYHAQNIFFSDGEDHRVKRSWAMRLSERQRLPTYQALFREEIDALIDAVVDEGRCDLGSAYTMTMPLRVVRRIMDLPEEVDGLIKAMSVAIAEVENNPEPTAAQVAGFDDAIAGILRCLARVLRERQERLGDDYVSDLIRMQVERDGSLDVNALARQLAVTIFGADHAMAGHLADCMARIARDPELQERLRADRSLIRGFLSEALREVAPVPWMFRACRRDAEIANIPIPAGSLVLVALLAGNDDPAEFPAPERFDETRANVERNQLSLGRGAHRCAGATVARLLAEEMVNRMLDRLDDIRLDEERSDLVPAMSHVFHVKPAVHLTFRRRAGA